MKSGLPPRKFKIQGGPDFRNEFSFIFVCVLCYVCAFVLVFLCFLCFLFLNVIDPVYVFAQRVSMRKHVHGVNHM